MTAVYIVLLSIFLVLIGFSVYITGLISAKIDLIMSMMRYYAENSDAEHEYRSRQQLYNMMNYSARDRGDEIE